MTPGPPRHNGRVAHTDSLWWDTLPAGLRGPARPPLTENIAVDVAIVGAGYTGLWTAYYLLRQQPDLRLVIIDAQVAGFGASSRNGGWCSALLPIALSTIAKQSSRDAAIAWQRQMFATVQEVGTVAATEGIDCDFRLGGTVQLARSSPQLSRAHAEVADARSGVSPTTMCTSLTNRRLEARPTQRTSSVASSRRIAPRCIQLDSCAD